jgi:hypothetical protein
MLNVQISRVYQMKAAEKILQAPIPNQLIDTVWGLVYKRSLKHFSCSLLAWSAKLATPYSFLFL